MSYYIFRIGYQISDEIKKRKENEKPFWWEKLHPEAKNKTIEEIDQLIIPSCTPEKFKEMTRHEKYMVVSESAYAIDLVNAKAIAQELEELKASQAAQQQSSFLDQTHTEGSQPGDHIPKPGGHVIPYPDKDDLDPAPLDINHTAGPGEGNEPKDEPGAGGATEPITLKPATEGTAAVATGGPSDVKPATKAQIRKYAIDIVRNTVNQINTEAEKIPVSPGFIPAEELLAAVIIEIQNKSNFRQ